MKFKILPKVAGFVDPHGLEHLPGEIVDLPPSYLGEAWLEPVEEPKKVEVPPLKIEKIEEKPSEEQKPAEEENPQEEEPGPFGKKSKKSRY